MVDGSGNLPKDDDREVEARLEQKARDGIDQATPGVDEAKAEPFEWRPSPTQARASYFGDHENKDSSRKNSQKTDRVMDTQAKREVIPPANGESGSSLGVKADSTSASRSQHVLLVEDNQINQRLLSRKLEKKGFKVTTANNGQEAVARVKGLPSSGDRSSFDIILMDKEMPLLDGNAATREIRDMEQRGGGQRAPIIGVTANVRDEQQEEMIASGMDDVISKPYEIDEMVSVVNLADNGLG